MRKPTLEGHETWLVDIDGRLRLLENSQLYPDVLDDIRKRLDKLEEEPVITKVTTSIRMDYKSLQLAQRIRELGDELQEHFKFHKEERHPKKKDVI